MNRAWLWIGGLLAAACSFEPRRSGIEFDVSKLSYERPAPGEATFSYEATRRHELQELCTYLVAAQAGERLTLRGPGYLPATPEHCFVTSAVRLQPGDKRRFAYTFPGESGLFTDPRAKMRAMVRLKVLREGQTVPHQTNWPFD